jgi:hypothetical protein
VGETRGPVAKIDRVKSKENIIQPTSPDSSPATAPDEAEALRRALPEHYSPTETVIESSAQATLRALWSPTFDPRRLVVLTEPIEGTLVSATDAVLYFERGAVQVSTGQSLLVLPLQYSRCLTLDSDSSGKLVRANLVDTGLLFAGKINAITRNRFGLFYSGCRKHDLGDRGDLKIFDEEHALWSQVHPHALSHFADVPAAMKTLVTKIINAKE